MSQGNESSNVIDRLLLNSANGNSFDIICSELASDIIIKKTTFVELVGVLESLLTNTDLNKHIVGLDVVASVLESLPKDFFLTTELEVIVQFFCGQVKQHHSFIAAALKGIIALVRSPQLSKASLQEITTTLFNNVVWQTQTHSDRRIFLSLLQYVIFTRIEDYSSVSSEFLFNVISAVDGERDPRNLLLLFSFLPKLFSSIPLGHLNEDAFEVVSCYFPIDFNSSRGEVSREDLVSALTPCLLAVPNFTDPCVSLILEKLESTLKSARVDSYHLLMEGCKVWQGDSLEPHWSELWQAIKQDTLPPRDPLTSECATQALQSLVKAMPESSLTPLLTSVVNNCEPLLSDAQLSLFEPACRLLLSTMQGSSAAALFVSYKLLPTLVSLLQVSQSRSKVSVLDKLTAFIQVCLHHNLDLDSGGEAMWGVLVSCLAGDANEVQAAYTALTLAPRHLPPHNRLALYPCLLAHLTTLPTGPLRSACVKCLQALATTYEDEIQKHIVENITVNQNEGKDLTSQQNRFEAVCRLAVLERFRSVLEQQFKCLVSCGSASATVAISCLKNLLEEKDVQNNSSLVHFLFSQSSLLPILVSLDSEGDDLLHSAAITQTLVRLQSSSEQKRVVEPLVQALLQCPCQTRQMVMLSSLLGPLRPDVCLLSPEELSRLVVPPALYSAESALARRSALMLLSVLLNKAADDTLLDIVSQHLQACPAGQATTAHAYITKALVLRGHPLMDHWLNKLVELVDSAEVGEVAAEGLQLVLEDCPLLSAQNHCQLVELVDSAEVGEVAAEGLQLVLEDCPLLSAQNHCQVRLLYRQRIFLLVLPRLVSCASQLPHLKTLACLLHSVPYTVYQPHIQQSDEQLRSTADLIPHLEGDRGRRHRQRREHVQLLPLLATSLDTDCEGLLLTVLHTLSSLLDSTNDSCLQDHADSFIPRFLKLSNHSPFMKVRIAALQCLFNSLKYSPIVLLPHKQQVLCQLVACLDDRKRLVRREAARTRAKWFLLGAPTSES